MSITLLFSKMSWIGLRLSNSKVNHNIWDLGYYRAINRIGTVYFDSFLGNWESLAVMDGASAGAQ